MIKRLSRFLVENKSVIIVCFLFSILLYYYYFREGFIVLGGEGNYWLDFKIYLENTGSTWINYGPGMIGMSISVIFSYPLIFSLIKSIQIKSFLIVYMTYILPFFTMYYLLRSLDRKSDNKFALIASLFFVINPYSVSFLNALNPWGVHILFMYPLLFLVLYRFYDNNLKLFLTVGITICIFAYTLANPPQMLLFIIFLSIKLLLIQILKTGKFNTKHYFEKAIIMYTSFLLYNLWWVVHWLIAYPSAGQFYSIQFAKKWLSSVSTNTPLFFNDFFSFNWLTPKMVNYNYFSWFYNTPVILFILFIPFTLFLIWIMKYRKKSSDQSFIFLSFGILLLITLVMKATNPPFKNIMSLCFDYVPFCFIYKTAPEKFGVPFVFISSLLFFFVLKNTKNKWFNYLSFIYIFFLIIPFATGNFIPNIFTDSGPKYASRKFKDLDEFKKTRKIISEEPLDIRILSYPTGANYQVMLHNYDNMYFTGLDPILMNTSKSYIADHMSETLWPIFSSIGTPLQRKLLAIYSIRFIHLNRRLVSWFGNPTGKDLPTLEKLLNQNYLLVWHNGEQYLYKNTNFLPHIFTPKKIFYNISDDKIFINLQNISINDRPALFSVNKNEKLLHKVNIDVLSLNPVVEFKRISVTKYKIILHKIKGVTPIIFNESYHNLWKIYNVPPFSVTQINNFISPNIHGTIQNNNIPSDHWYETFIKSYKIPDENHLKVNGYANAWIIDPENICAKSNCKRNTDGSYELFLVVEFWPQRILPITILISACFVLLSLGYFILKLTRNNHAS